VSELLRQGGVVLIAILCLSSIAWASILWKWLQLAKEAQLTGTEEALRQLRLGRRAEAQALCRPEQLAGRVVLAGISSGPGAAGQRRLAPLVEAEALHLSDGLSVVAVIAAALPLLGLLGTVMGMIETFAAVTLHGTNDPVVLADGVSQALITTQAGLVAALPVLLSHSMLSSRVGNTAEGARLLARRVGSALRDGSELQEAA